MPEAPRFSWWLDFLRRLRGRGLRFDETAGELPPARVLRVDVGDWLAFGQESKAMGMRWCALWADEVDDRLRLSGCLAFGGDYLLARCRLEAEEAEVASWTPCYPAADGPERHARDLFGVRFAGHPDARRWTRHKAWGPDRYPLRKGFPVAGESDEPTPPDADYPFVQAQGAGAFEIPVGPIHAGIIEPGHFRFQAVGETVLNLERHLGYTHKGIEKIGEGRDAVSLARLAARVSGDTTVSHAWAACMAMERAASLQLPPRATALRAVMAERERVANHLGDIGAVCNDVGFAFAHYQMSRLREDWLRMNREAFGHRLMMDRVIPGGVSVDPEPTAIKRLLAQVETVRRELKGVLGILAGQESLRDRLETTGVLSPDIAAELGCLGYVGRASGQRFDVRRDCPYAPYDGLDVRVPASSEGDVAARVRVRAEEALVSMALLELLLASLPGESTAVAWTVPRDGAEGLAAVESWRGEIITYVRFGSQGRVERFFPRDPSWLNWPALDHLMRGNIVPDFPVCNKSVNGSYSGHDL